MSKRGTCWVGYEQKGMKKKGNKMVPNCVPAGMKKGGLKIGLLKNGQTQDQRKKVEDLENVEENLRVHQNENIQSACLLQKQQA